MINRGKGIFAGGSHNIAFEDSRSWHLQAIHKFPLISQEEELALTRQWRDRQDMAASKSSSPHISGLWRKLRVVIVVTAYLWTI
jgi:Sigma-70 factor, region 1.2